MNYNHEYEYFDSGDGWTSQRCVKCGDIISDEPDWEYLNEIKHISPKKYNN